jgi:hypothetical protein
MVLEQGTYILRTNYKFLVYTLERWHRLALLLIQGLVLNGTVGQVNLAVGVLLVSKSVLHPVLVVTVGVIFTGMGTARFLAVSSGVRGLGAISD